MRALVPSPSRRAIVLLALVMALVIVPAASALAASDYFLKIDDIEGESTDTAHAGQIDVESWSWGETNAGSHAGGGGGGAGKVNFSDLSFTKALDKSTPKLMEAIATGKHIAEAKLTLRKAGEDPHVYLVITMTDVLVTSYQVSGSEGDDRPTEQLSLNFAKVQVDYFLQGADGTTGEKVSFGWDLKKNKAV